MSRYNLIDESWIPVIVDENGRSEKVSLKQLFENSKDYIGLACDTKTQEFAILRFLLSITHTVFSRFDFEGKKYEFLELDERFKQIENIDEDDKEDYEEKLMDTWSRLWQSKKFPKIVIDYLEKWHDRFYLFDEKYPFYQVIKDDISEEKISQKNPSSISGKNINRLISESGNKIALFSPKNASNKNKEILTEDEIARWLITFQGYTGLSDKVIFGSDKYKSSKGWIFDLGGIYFEGKNLFETLMLNMVMVSENNAYLSINKPCWEFSSSDLIKDYLILNNPLDIAQLYTTWSRAIYIDPNIDVNDSFSMDIVKLPDIDHRDKFLEPMTIWRKNESGDNKGTFTPKKHAPNKAMWRSFGNIALIKMESCDDVTKREPGLITWYKKISEYVTDKYLYGLRVKINSISMKDDNNATSWVPVDEIYDYLDINNIIITDDKKDGWTEIIANIVEETNSAVSFIYKNFIIDIKEIRKIKSQSFVDQKVEELYYLIDRPFRDWLSSIDVKDNKDEKVLEWRSILKKLIIKQADKIMANASNRDYTGVTKNDKLMNIATAYSSFKYFLNKKLIVKEEYND